MSAALDLLANLRRRGVEIEAVGDRLRWRTPKGVVSQADLTALKAAKSELLAALESEGEPPAEWFADRAAKWFDHLRKHDPERASWHFARELAVSDWKLAQTRQPGVA